MSSSPPDFPALLARYERPLVRYAYGLLQDLEGARDVVQETFIRLARSAPPGLEGNHLEGWLFTVCRHRAVDYQRKHARLIPMPIVEESHMAETPDPAALAERNDTEGSLLRLLETLPAHQREVLRLKFQHDLSYKEIAAVTELSVTNVGFLLHTGLRKLRALWLQTSGEGAATVSGEA